MASGSNRSGTLEDRAYRDSYSDGIIDVFVGLSAAWIGIAWIWLEDFAGLAGIFPAIFASLVVSARKPWVESRTGYVKWRAPRRAWQRRNYFAMLGVGVMMFLLGVGMFFALGGESPTIEISSSWIAALPAWLVAMIAIGLAVIMRAPRMVVYALVLIVGGVLTAAADAKPGWPLLATGVVITATGVVMLRRFVRANPVVPES